MNWEEDEDLFIGPQEFVVGYSKAPEQPQSSTRPICHSHAMTSTGRKPATKHVAAWELAALCTAPGSGSGSGSDSKFLMGAWQNFLIWYSRKVVSCTLTR